MNCLLYMTSPSSSSIFPSLFSSKRLLFFYDLCLFTTELFWIDLSVLCALPSFIVEVSWRWFFLILVVKFLLTFKIKFDESGCWLFCTGSISWWYFSQPESSLRLSKDFQETPWGPNRLLLWTMSFLWPFLGSIVIMFLSVTPARSRLPPLEKRPVLCGEWP